MTTKTCPRCREAKDRSAFGPDPNKRDGRNSYCRPCVAAKSAEYRKAHPDRERAAQRRWQLAHPEKMRAKTARSKARYPGRYRARYAAWQKENAERCQAHTAARRALKRNAPGDGVSPEQWEEVLAGSLGLCAYCGEPTAALTMDHVEPLTRGGAHDPANVVAACLACNSSKHNYPLIVWMARRAA